MALILIVEDDDQVRVLAEGILQDGGHTTLSASTADQALALLDGDDRIDLLFTDLGLQSDIQAGLMLAQEASKRKTDLAVLYTTGQGLTDGMQAMFVDGYEFLAKPYTPEQLLTSIEKLLPKD
ncbi:MAG TPA: response regulator [Pseudolabrys sp.]|jgi:DNA-binding NtrC family response regulator|nr:response regulator [Pseudolabrys sp.]